MGLLLFQLQMFSPFKLRNSKDAALYITTFVRTFKDLFYHYVNCDSYFLDPQSMSKHFELVFGLMNVSVYHYRRTYKTHQLAAKCVICNFLILGHCLLIMSGLMRYVSTDI